MRKTPSSSAKMAVLAECTLEEVAADASEEDDAVAEEADSTVADLEEKIVGFMIDVFRCGCSVWS